MNLQENILLLSSVLGLLLGMALISYIFREKKANFFLGLIVLLMSLELMFSWGSHSGYNHLPGAFPFWALLSYHIIPPSIWLFVRCSFDATFKLRRWYAFLFIPAVVEILIHFSVRLGIFPFSVNLMEYSAWYWYIDYIPLLGFILSLVYFWTRYFQMGWRGKFAGRKGTLMAHAKLLLLMSILSCICLLWVLFTFTGWEYFSLIEFLLVFLLLVLSFLIFLDSQPFPMVDKLTKSDLFSHYDDRQQLKRLHDVLCEKQLFIRPNLSLKELSQELNLPPRYLSYLINQHFQKNFKEFINDYRVEAFISKAKLPESKHKTLLALALESGFNSKSAFNQVFKDHKGRTPSEYLS